MGKGSRNKGAAGEREVIELLRPWWRRLDPTAEFARTPGSGGWSRSKEFEVAGDVVVKGALRWPWSVEVKREEAWDPKRLAQSRPSPVYEWWRQCVRDAVRTGRSPMLWFRRNREAWTVGIQARLLFGVWWRRGFPDARIRPDEDLLISRGVDFGNILPVFVGGEEFLSSDPEKWAGRFS